MEIGSIENFKSAAGPPSVTSIGMYNPSDEAGSDHRSLRADGRKSSELLDTSLTKPSKAEERAKAAPAPPQNAEVKKTATETLENSDLNFIKKVKFDRERYFRLHFKIEKPEKALVEEALQHFEKRFETEGTENSEKHRTGRERKSTARDGGSVNGNSVSGEGDRRSTRKVPGGRPEAPQLIITKKVDLSDPRHSTGVAGSKRVPLAPKNLQQVSLDESGDLDFLPRNAPKMTEGGSKNPYHFSRKNSEIGGNVCQVPRQTSMPVALQATSEPFPAHQAPKERKQSVLAENTGCFCQEIVRKLGALGVCNHEASFERVYEHLSLLTARMEAIERSNLQLVKENECLRMASGVKSSRLTFFEPRHTLPNEKSEHLRFKKKSNTARTPGATTGAMVQLKKTSICGPKLRI